MSPKKTPFRVHMSDGRALDILAATPAAASAEAKRRNPEQFITKIKVVREIDAPALAPTMDDLTSTSIREQF